MKQLKPFPEASYLKPSLLITEFKYLQSNWTKTLPFIYINGKYSLSLLYILAPHRVDIWLGTDLNTKRFSKP